MKNENNPTSWNLHNPIVKFEVRSKGEFRKKLFTNFPVLTEETYKTCKTPTFYYVKNLLKQGKQCLLAKHCFASQSEFLFTKSGGSPKPKSNITDH